MSRKKKKKFSLNNEAAVVFFLVLTHRVPLFALCELRQQRAHPNLPPLNLENKNMFLLV